MISSARDFFSIHYWLVPLGALGSACAVGTPDAPRDEAVDTATQGLSQICTGTTTVPGPPVYESCSALQQSDCTSQNGCFYCADVGCVIVGFPLGCSGNGGAVVSSTQSLACSNISSNDCSSYPGCSLYTVPPPAPKPAGYYFVNSQGFYANSSGQYCLLDSWAQCVAAGNACTRHTSPSGPFPSSMVYVGECLLPAGYFFSNGTGYYANGAGHYCAFTSWDKWVAAGGPRAGAPTFVPIPASMVYDGICSRG